MSDYPSIEDLVPHGEPIRMIESLEAWEPGYARCAMTIRDSTPFAQEGAVSSVVALEIMAQGVAACLGYEAFRAGGGVRVGMIIASRSFEIFEPEMRVGDALRVEVRRQRGNEDLSHFHGEVHVDTRLVSKAHMTVYHAEKPPE